MFVCILFFIGATAFAQSQLTEKEKFKGHLDSIRNMDTMLKIQQTHGYLKNLTDKELFNLMDDLAKKNPSSIQQGLFISQLKNRWNNNPPVNNIANEVKSKQRDKNYRKIMIDYLTSSLRKKARSEIKSEQTIRELKEITKDYENIIADSADIKEIRTYAMSNIASLLGILRESNNLTAQEKNEYGDFFIKKLKDSTEDEFLRSKAPKALRSLDDRRALPYLRDILKNNKTNEVHLKRSSIVALAKMNDIDSIPDISQILDDTTNQDIFEMSTEN